MFLIKNRGQVAFEFIIVLSIVLLLSTSVMLDFYTESNMSLMAGYVKNLAETQIGVMSIEDAECTGAYLHSFNITEDNNFHIVVKSRSDKCKPSDGDIAREVEKNLCGGESNYNNVIECGADEYIVRVEWKRDR